MIERAMELWSNPGDLVFSPFTGIGSEGYVSIEMGRRFIGAELKRSYFDLAKRNLTEARKTQVEGLFADEHNDAFCDVGEPQDSGTVRPQSAASSSPS